MQYVRDLILIALYQHWNELLCAKFTTNIINVHNEVLSNCIVCRVLCLYDLNWLLLILQWTSTLKLLNIFVSPLTMELKSCTHTLLGNHSKDTASSAETSEDQEYGTLSLVYVLYDHWYISSQNAG